MKKILEKLKAFMPVIKIIFFTSIIILIVVELFNLKRTISVKELNHVFQGIPVINIFLIFLIGSLAVLPTTGYDFIVNKILKTKHSVSYILQTSWCINTFNNLTGFGGIIDIGLRLAFYGKEGEEEKELQEVTRFLPYFRSVFHQSSFSDSHQHFSSSTNSPLLRYYSFGSDTIFPAHLLVFW